MVYVAVISSTGKPLMPCHPARARELILSRRAVGRFDRGQFYIRLLARDDGERQAVVVGIDPGSKKEGFSVKSQAHTYLNVQTDAVTWVSEHVKTRRVMRRARRHRNSPYRKCRPNRHQGQNRLAPSTRSRWGWKLRICRWLARVYPVSTIAIEDIAARTRKGQRRWNTSFSPLECGKLWAYEQFKQIAPLHLYRGYETKAERDSLGLKKSSHKLLDRFEAHCVDSWVLANKLVGGHSAPDNITVMYLVPLQFHRRQLHRLEPAPGGIRKPYGGTLSMGLKRGSWVKHPQYGLCYIGGQMGGRISLHDPQSGKRLCQNAKPESCQFLTTASWRVRSALCAKA